MRRLLPKGNGTRRPLGRPALADTLVAKAVARLLEAISAQDCSDCSHGCRPGRSPQQALHEGRQGLRGSRRGQGIAGDSRACFETLPQATLRAMLRQRITDSRVLQRLEQWLHAGLLDGKARGCPDTGSPPGSVRSPRLANVYVHAVRETWCETVVRAPCRGQVARWRCADDCVMGCAWAEDARRLKEVLPQRFATSGREINTEKTPVVDGGRPQRSSAGRQPGTCSCLGFVHYWGTTWRGGDPSTRQTEGKRRRRTLGECWRWCRDNRPRPLQEQYALRCAKLRGDYQYYGLRCNSPC